MKKKIIAKTLFDILMGFCMAQSQLVLSEYMGDPGAMSDFDGEYLEFINPGSNPVQEDTVTLILNQDTSTLVDFKLNSKEIILLCRDSLAMQGFDITCFNEWSAINLSNSKPSEFSLVYSGKTIVYNLQMPRPGASWENTLDAGKDYADFIPAEKLSSTGDLGTPGELPSHSALVLAYDLSLDSLIYTETKEGLFFEYFIRNTGSRPVGPGQFQILLDKDWNGLPEKTIILGNLPVIPVGTLFQSDYLLKGPPIPGIYRFEISPDENNNNNSRQVFNAKPSPLNITEVCPAPIEGSAEWIEIKNTGEVSLSLKNLFYNNSPVLGPRPAGNQSIGPGEYLILTGDSADLQTQFGDLGVNILEIPDWNVLKNSGGDTVTLTGPGGVVIDSMVYPGLGGLHENVCFIRDAGNPEMWITAPVEESIDSAGETGRVSPGYEVLQSKKFSWSLSSRILDISDASRFIQLTLEVPWGERIDVTVFDLNGFPVRVMAKGLSGNETLFWNGRHDNGTLLPIGPYILWIRKNSQTVLKKPIILARPL